MKITEYLEKYGMTHRDFAAMIGVTEGMVSHYVTGRHLPKVETALRIERLTDGDIRREDMMPALFDGFTRV